MTELSPTEKARPPEADPRLFALDLLGRSFESGIDRESGLEAFPPRDRALIQQLVQGTLRSRGTLDYYLKFFLRRDFSALPPRVADILRLAVFQLKFCDRIPDYAVVNTAVEQAKAPAGGRFSGLVNAVLRRLLRDWDKMSLPGKAGEPLVFLEVRYSHPRWLVARYLERFGLEEAERLLAANNTQAPLVIRNEEALSRLGDPAPALKSRLEREGIIVTEGKYAAEALVLTGTGISPAALPGFGGGLIYVQDEAAMLAARLAAPAAGSLILDLCAAPGGKATHLARLGGRNCLVVAADLNFQRLTKLKANLRRLGLDNVRLVVCDAGRPCLMAADLVFCDVPCTGTGVMRRKPDLRWRIKLKDLVKLSRLQSRIISACAACVRPGGVLLYSTCSIEPEENWEVVSGFLAAHPDFSLDRADRYIPAGLVSREGCLETFPHRHGIDGSFAARLVRGIETCAYPAASERAMRSLFNSNQPAKI